MAPEHKLRVIAPDVGGGFGSKIFIYPEEVVCLWASKKVGRPVKWTSDRSEAFLADAHGRDHVTHAEMAFDDDGKIIGLKVQDHRQSRRLHVDLLVVGADLSLRDAAVGPVRHPGDLLRGRRGLHQHRAGRRLSRRRAGRKRPSWSSGWSRSARASWASIPPICARRTSSRSFPHQTPVIMAYDAGDYHASLKKAMEIADVKGFGKRKREARAHGKLRGIGYSTYIEACGIAPSQAVGSLGAGVGLWESAEVRVNPTGSVEVLTGCHSHGQGHETTFAQLVSERLGIPIDNVSIVHGDTDKVQFGMGTYGSRSGAVGMSAIVKALDKVEAKAKKVAAFMLEAAEGDIEFKDGKFTVAGTDKSAAWGDVTLNAYIAHKFTGARARAGTEGGRVLRPDQLHVPGRLPHLRGRDRSRHRPRRHRRLDRGRRLRHRDQSDDRRGPGAWRRRAGRRPGAARRRGLRQGRPARVRLVHGLRDAARREFPDLQGRHDHDQMPVQPARHQGLRRGGRDRGAGGGHQRHHRRDRQRRSGHAGDRPRRSGRRSARPRRCNAQQNRNTGRPSMYEFKYRAPELGPAGGQHAGQGRGGEDPRGRPFAAARR